MRIFGGCCWPGQKWTKAKGCAGTPSCPAGMTAQGTECLIVCSEGKTTSIDTAGHCCWPQQVWSLAQSRCVGAPQCPASLVANEDDCTIPCAPGKRVSSDTAGQCCWPQQVWSASRQLCVGIPACPLGWRADAETCAVELVEEVPPPLVASPAADAGPAQPAQPDGGLAGVVMPDAGSPLMPAANSEFAAPDAGTAAPAAAVAATAAKAAVPAGRVRTPSTWLFVGAAVFALGYIPALVVPSAMGNQVPNANRVAPIPLVGPLMVRNTLSDRALENGWNVICIADALLQWAGAAMMIGGALKWGIGEEPTEQKVSVWFSPAGGGAVVRW